MDINNENILIKREGKTDLTQVANEAYKDGGKDFVKQLGQAGATFIEFYNNTIGGLFELYNTWARLKIEQTKEDIANRMLKIPNEKLTTPKINVLGPALEGLKYNLNEEELKEMFENLIVNSCNSDYSDTIHPRFAEIIKQLSSSDAILLKELSSDTSIVYPIVNIINKLENNYNIIFQNFYNSKSLSIHKVPMALNNLQSLGIIKINFSEFISDTTVYDSITKTDFYTELARTYPNISYKKGMISFTALGENFARVCI